MGILQFAVGSLMTTSHPTITRIQCWNLRANKEKCSRCIDICPKSEKLFKRAGLVQDWTACMDCGLCVSACPTRCIAPSQEQVDKDCAPADIHNDTIWIGCDQSQRHNDVLRECISAFSWEQLAFLALNKKLVLDLTPCGECENDACADNLRRVLQRLVDFFGERAFSTRISLAYEPDEYPYVEQSLSRRELANRVTDTSKNSTRRLVKNLPMMKEEDSGHAFDFRMLLHTRTKMIKQAASTPIPFGVSLPTVNENCYGCGRCERACKPGALKLVDGEDGISRLIVTPWKCDECGQCVRGCSIKAIEGMKLRQVQTLGPVIVHKVRKRLCEDCGKPMQLDIEGNVCRICVSRRKAKERQEEARQRRLQLEAEQAAKQAAEQAEQAAADAAAEAAPQPAAAEQSAAAVQE